jgi:hypothetical protein
MVVGNQSTFVRARSIHQGMMAKKSTTAKNEKRWFTWGHCESSYSLSSGHA